MREERDPSSDPTPVEADRDPSFDAELDGDLDLQSDDAEKIRGGVGSYQTGGHGNA